MAGASSTDALNHLVQGQNAPAPNPEQMRAASTQAANEPRQVKRKPIEQRVEKAKQAVNPVLSAARPLLRALADMPSTLRVDQAARLKDVLEQELHDFQTVCERVGTVFSRASGEPLERGIPGLFTYAGYHNLFNARLPEFVNKAQAIDAWVMGRAGASAQKKRLRAQQASWLATTR
ncbi:ImcF-related family protein [Ralstonia sp. GX3-BWBA]|uniref:ImcF-related family protein n=1 Tax=Ralstonia sp. GX3-BWBA TaxID=2219865 RepID=UPI0023B797BC|nr:ImcF-related family protein [Ralstonia sp. GX3-BWBA]